MAERRVRSRRKTKSGPTRNTEGVQQEVAGLLVTAAGTWFLLSLAGRGGGALGELLSRGLKAIAGSTGAWIIGILMIWFGLHLIYLRFHNRLFEWGRRSWGLLLLFLAVEALIQFWTYGSHPTGGDWENALQGFGGGILGFAIAVPLTAFFGHSGRYVILVASVLVGLVLNTGVTLGGIVNWIKEQLSSGARSAGAAAGDLYKLASTRPQRPTAAVEEAAPSPPPRRKRRAATEELNTLEIPAKAQPDEPVVHMPDPAGQTAVVAEPHAPSIAADAQSRNSGRSGTEMVPDSRGQLMLDPSQLGDAFQLPSLTMLPKPAPAKGGASRQDHVERAELLVRTLGSFGVEARVVAVSPGPVVTRYELQPGEGVRVNKFTALADDIALAMAAEDIRIEAPIPGKAAVGIEVPNKQRQAVMAREVMETSAFLDSPSKLTVAFGKDNAGNAVVGDLIKMPHLLIAGSTGSGKSVCMNTIISSILFKARPDEVKMMMIDPKMVELSVYNGIPHLMAPVITDVRKAAGYLKGAVKEMENRYELFAAVGARNIQQYNQMCLEDPGDDPENPRKPLPYVVIFIDELADLMMVAPVDVEDAICRLAQMARACGMHLVIATQSPRVDVITGLIKANIPSRIAFAVSSQVDSRVIMDYTGAERLLGKGDMLYHPTGLSKPIRVQGAFIGEKDVEKLVRFVKAQAKPEYTAEEVAVDITPRGRGAAGGGEPTSAVDAAFPEALRIVIENGQASVSVLQRRLPCNYNKAARLIDMMEERGYIGPHQGSRPRDVLISMAQYQELFGADQEETNQQQEETIQPRQ